MLKAQKPWPEVTRSDSDGTKELTDFEKLCETASACGGVTPLVFNTRKALFQINFE